MVDTLQAAAPAAPTGRWSKAWWSRIAGGLVAIAALVRLAMWGIDQVHPLMPGCNSSRVQDTLNDIYKKRASLDVKKMEDVRTLSHSDTAASCSAHLTLSNDEKNIIVYGLSRDGRSIQVRIEKATDG